MGKPVLLVDADLRRPRLQKIFRGKMNLGLVNYLPANVPIEDVIQESGVPNLSVVLSGPTPQHLLGTDALGRDVLSRLLYGGRVTLLGAAVAVTVFLILGIPLGIDFPHTQG